MKELRKNKDGEVLCELCSQSFKYKKGLSKHLSYTHKYDKKKYYDEYLKEENEEMCPVCEKNTDFIDFRAGYKKLCKNCLNKSKFPSNIEYWIYHGYSKFEAELKVKEFQSAQSKKVTNRLSNTQLNYWIKKGYSNEEAHKKLKERQATGSLENFRKRYGDLEGKIKWKNRQSKWQNTMSNKSPEEMARINKLKGITLENMIRKWGTVEGTRRYYQWLDKIHYNLKYNILSYSKISQELFNNLLKNILDKENVKFATHKKEKVIKTDTYLYFYDFCYKDKIIEFNGDIWHANPKLFNENEKPNPHSSLTSKDIWNYDKEKIKAAEKIGYKTLIVWENDYKNNPKEIEDKCRKFIHNEH